LEAFVLSKKGSLSHPPAIKPELAPEEVEGKVEAYPVSIPRSGIKIWDSRLYVKKLFGYFDKSELQYCSSPPQSYPTSTDHIQSDVQTLRENTPLSHNAPPFVPDNSTIVSQSPSAILL